jgi:hypothetical protein
LIRLNNGWAGWRGDDDIKQYLCGAVFYDKGYTVQEVLSYSRSQSPVKLKKISNEIAIIKLQNSKDVLKQEKIELPGYASSYIKLGNYMKIIALITWSYSWAVLRNLTKRHLQRVNNIKKIWQFANKMLVKKWLELRDQVALP